jgi:hypothetical protein
MSTFSFDIDKFTRDSKNTLLNPNRFFSSLELTGGLSEPLMKVVAYGFITGLVYLICWLFRIRSFGAGYTGDAVGLLAFIKIIIVTVACSGIGTLILMFISVICHGNSGFEPVYRVTGSLMTVLPVYAVLSISWNLNYFLGLGIAIIISIYSLWLLYYGLTASLKCRKKNMRPIIINILVLIFLLTFLSLRSNINKKAPAEIPKKHSKEVKKK